MKGKVGWVDGGRFLAESGTGHALPMHAKILGDEVTTAPSPNAVSRSSISRGSVYAISESVSRSAARSAVKSCRTRSDPRACIMIATRSDARICLST